MTNPYTYNDTHINESAFAAMTESPRPLPLALTPQAWLQALPDVLRQLEPDKRTAFVIDVLRASDGAGVEVAGCAVDCINSMIYWK